MKNVTTIAAVVAVLAVGAIIAVAQIEHNGGFRHHFKDLGNHQEQMIDDLSDKLKLSDM